MCPKCGKSDLYLSSGEDGEVICCHWCREQWVIGLDDV